mgnify:CR=1 FL=1
MKPTHLVKAPIVEAVVEFRVSPTTVWEPKRLKDALIKSLPFYQKIEEGKEFVYSLSLEGAQPKQEELGCVGYKLTSDDGRYVVQFNKQAFVFSQVKDYKDWECLSDNAKQLWSIYCALLKPQKVKRIGVRFINHMRILSKSFSLASYFVNPPEEKQVEGWDLGRFIHHDVLAVPNTSYFVNLMKTVIPPTGENLGKVVLDIDVSLDKDVECAWEKLDSHLLEMREIKNKAFFENIAEGRIGEYLK